MTETDRPLVTFALFAYNQEKYIREAVEGAFAQTYEPLEIILSDDCSSDRTFEIMQEMAAAYEGPHEVRVRQSEVNSGLVNHVCDVADMLTGKFVLLAAGDDISKPERTETIMTFWSDKYCATLSKCDLIDDSGAVLRTGWVADGDLNSRLPWLKSVSCSIFVYGASSAYRADILKKLPRSSQKIFSEDTPLNLLIQIENLQVGFCESSLVYYRVHEKTISNSLAISPTPSSILDHEKKRQSQIENSRNLLVYLRDSIVIPTNSVDRVDEKMIDLEIKCHNLKLDWYKSTPFSRFKMTFNAIEGTQMWLAYRALGLRTYSFIKSVALRSGLQRSAPKG